MKMNNILRRLSLYCLTGSYSNSAVITQLYKLYYVPKLQQFSQFGAQYTTKSIYVYDDNTNTEDTKISTKYTDRTHTCGELRSTQIGEKVILSGWLEFRRMEKFLILRDAYGHTQLLIRDEDEQIKKISAQLPLESIIRVEGTVFARPKDMINKKQATGEIEVLIEKFEVLNEASDVLPFNIREFQKAKESLRMQYRYLDLRFAEMQRNMRVRSRMLMDMRDFLVNKRNFVDVETPTLFKATPGGAQEFVVPTQFPGLFYSLVQSPQQFKQMLMAGAIDRYFQIARCYRDEGSRSDRQPEFTQLDIEVSFANAEGVIELVEELIRHSWPSFLEPLPLSFPRMSYSDALENYGNDKPDTRFGFKIKNCTKVLEEGSRSDTNFGAYYLIFPEQFSLLTSSVKRKLSEISKKYPLAKFVQNKVTSKTEWTNSVGKLLGENASERFASEINLPDNCTFFLSYGNKKHALALLGKVRLEYANHVQNSGKRLIDDGMQFLWITDFPLFERDENGHLQSAHHPFTAPHPEDLHLLDGSPEKVRALAYDLVLNGQEVAGGSIRIHNAPLQERVLNLLKIEKDTLRHMLEMLKSGCPPHGGIALGLDRLLSVVMKTPSIRDVIAFPKTFEGRDPISGAPSHITEKDKKLYHIETTK